MEDERLLEGKMLGFDESQLKESMTSVQSFSIVKGITQRKVRLDENLRSRCFLWRASPLKLIILLLDTKIICTHRTRCIEISVKSNSFRLHVAKVVAL